MFVEGQAFAESQDYGVHGERVRKACWGYLCRGGAVELREVRILLSFLHVILPVTSLTRFLLESDSYLVEEY